MKLEKLLPKNQFARSISVLIGGTAGGQLIVIAASPILTRLYSPEEFGLLAVYLGILGILCVITSLRYQLAIPLPEKDTNALNVTALSLIILAVLTLCLVIMVWVFGDFLVDFLNAPNFKPFLWLLPVGFAVIGIFQVLQYWSLRLKAFGPIAKAKIVQATSTAGVQVIGAAVGPLALLAGRVIGQVIADIMLWKNSTISVSSIRNNVTPKGIAAVAKQYRQFPIFSSWSGLLNACGAQVPVLFFAAAFGPAVAGGYMLAQRVINMPLTVVGKAVSDAFLPKSVDALRANRLGGQVTKLFDALASLMFPSAILLFFVAPDLFDMVFGDDWRLAGEIVRWLSPMLAIQFLINPVSRIFVTVERQDLALFFQGCLFGLRVGAFVIAYIFDFSLIETVQIFSLGSIAGYLLYMIAICKVSDISAISLLEVMSVTALLSGAIYVICFLTYSYLNDQIFSLLVCVCGGAVAIAVNLLWCAKRIGLYK